VSDTVEVLSDTVEVLLDGACATCDTIMYAVLCLIVLFGIGCCWRRGTRSLTTFCEGSEAMDTEQKLERLAQYEAALKEFDREVLDDFSTIVWPSETALRNLWKELQAISGGASDER
jgi:hypothetical protein